MRMDCFPHPPLHHATLVTSMARRTCASLATTSHEDVCNRAFLPKTAKGLNLRWVASGSRFARFWPLLSIQMRNSTAIKQRNTAWSTATCEHRIGDSHLRSHKFLQRLTTNTISAADLFCFQTAFLDSCQHVGLAHAQQLGGLCWGHHFRHVERTGSAMGGRL